MLQQQAISCKLFFFEAEESSILKTRPCSLRRPAKFSSACCKINEEIRDENL
jgi:hypothetical protein